MATRKPDAEVGPLGVWAYDTARLLGLSPAQIAHRAGVTEPTIRKIEGGSNRNPSRRVILEMERYFREVADAQGITIAAAPGEWTIRRPDDQSALVTAINDLVALLRPVVERAEEQDRRLRAVEVAVALLNQRADGPDPAPSLPRGTAG